MFFCSPKLKDFRNKYFGGTYRTYSSRRKIYMYNIDHIFFCFWKRAPQEMLRTQRSLEAYCATLWWRLVFPVFLVMEHRWNEIDRGKPKYSEKKTCLSATLSTTNTTWTDPGSKPGLCGERPATNRLSHGTALTTLLAICWRGVKRQGGKKHFASTAKHCVPVSKTSTVTEAMNVLLTKKMFLKQVRSCLALPMWA
jgi:hypothetical protein